MKKSKLEILGIIGVSVVVLGGIAIGCGNKKTTEASATEILEAVVDTEAVETAVPEAATEELDTEAAEETETTEAVEETEETATYTFTDMNVTKYAKSSVNVRDLPNTDGNRVGGLSTNQQVTVTGQCNETGWYRIELNGTVAYVSNSYLVDQKVVVNTNSGNNNNASASGNSNTADNNNANAGTIDTTQPVNDTTSTNTDNSGWTDTSSSAPAVDNTVNTPSADNSANASSGTVTTEPDYSQMSPEELAAATGATLGQTGGSAGTGVGGNWIE